MNRLIPILENIPEFKSLLKGLLTGVSQQSVYGLSGSQKGFFLAALSLKLKRPFLLITHSEEAAMQLQSTLEELVIGMPVLYFPALDWMPFEVLGKSRDIEAKRVQILAGLQKRVCVVTTVQALERVFLPAEIWRNMRIQLKVGETYQLDSISTKLVGIGYERVGSTEGKGQFSIRGGILDCYPLNSEPVRLEFFDDELDSIRQFDALTQRTTNQLSEATFFPAHELVINRHKLDESWPVILNQSRKVVAKLRKGSEQVAQLLQQYIDQMSEKVAVGINDENFVVFTPFCYPELASLLDYVSEDTFVILDEGARAKEYLDFNEREKAEGYLDLLEAGKTFVDPSKLFLNFKAFSEACLTRQTLLLSSLPRQYPGFKPKNLVNFVTHPMQSFAGSSAGLADEIKTLKKDGYTIALLANGTDTAERLKSMLGDFSLNAPLLKSPIESGQIGILQISLSGGFRIPHAKLAVITEAELTAGPKKQISRRKKFASKGEKIAPFVDLKPGDFVVHANHGIGKYLGVERLDVGGAQRDYFLIKYGGEDKLYVPFDQINLMQKYLGGEGQAPKLYKLGGTDWVKVKNKVKSAVKEMAEDLLKLYAERDKVQGYSFSKDSVWQTEFEDRFPYAETPDQLQCIVDVKADMEKAKPMDRLICGDVGYGKTEVAIRAAFKAVTDGKQVAVLVPTTILAQQHFVTFSERFTGYPISIEMLSRFRSPREQKIIAQGLNEGSVDVVIGTHRLVSEDIKFKNLGLVIVDEEQRFGVSHKEKLKLMKKNVDVLTLSATPIPRTLHMAMVNIRDMSVIETPPEDRYPVQTYVAEYGHELVRDALRREINRSGQAFYVHNRVQDLDKIVLDLGVLVPEAKIVSAHGQMREDDLEQVMIDFLEKRFDILVCTTIIESGLDLPNVNTLIVSDTDHMGLSQLYQLRGRVGRSNRRAYAYFLYRKDKVITEIAEKRLCAIRDFTEFGSGFKIAMRDLELRGAGNILGAEQHGQMASVGFDMYCKLLEQAVNELKGESKGDNFEPTIELDVSAYFDSEYIFDSSLKMEFYQRLMRLRTDKNLQDLTAELIDRFGDPPFEVINLLDIVAIRIRAIILGLTAVTHEKGFIKLKYGRDPDMSGEQLMELAKKVGPSLSFSATEGFEVRFRLSPRLHKNILKTVVELLNVIILIADKDQTLV